MSPRPNPLDGFTIDPATITYIGEGLQRPECILAERDGSLWSADARGGVVHIRPDGTQQLITQTASRGFAEAADEEARFVSGTLPNGLAFVRNGDVLISNFGTDRLEVRVPRDAIVWTKKLLEEEGVFAGVSGGAIARVAARIAGELDSGNVVFLIPDDGWKYLSSGVYTKPLEEIENLDSTVWW